MNSAVKNLAQLKRALCVGTKFEIVAHMRSENIGQIRRITKSTTAGFYSVVDGQPEHKISRGSRGLGAWCDFGKAAFWKFDDGICTLFVPKYRDEGVPSENIVMALKILEEENNDE